jgi:uncharacterized protein GlcG (DUF336 family)
MAIGLDEADRVVEGARAKAVELGIALSIAVVDEGGHLVALKRMDGAGFPTVEIARDKALTAAGFGADTALLAQSVGQMPAFTSGIQIAGGWLRFAGGGVALRREGRLLGGIGISGSSAEQDHECGQAGLARL